MFKTFEYTFDFHLYKQNKTIALPEFTNVQVLPFKGICRTKKEDDQRQIMLRKKIQGRKRKIFKRLE